MHCVTEDINVTMMALGIYVYLMHTVRNLCSTMQYILYEVCTHNVYII